MCKGVSALDPKSGKADEMDEMKNVCARSFFRDQDKIFIGTYGNGYYVWKNGKTIKMPYDKNQYLSHVHSFYIDKNNYLWMSTNNGLFRTRYSNVLSYLDDQDFKISYEYFGNDDGILNTEFNGGCTPPYVRLKNGYLSYPSMEGLVWLIPEKIPVADPDEKILIDELIIDNHKMPRDSAALVPSDHEFIEFQFATPYWGNIENLDLEYKLEGFSSNWSPIDPKENRIRFSNLSSGSYNFLIRKVHGSGQDPYIQSAMSFSVAKKFYETTGFILFVVALGACLIYLLMIMNSRRIIRENNELEKKIADRTNELKDVNIQLQENYRQLAQQENFLRESISVKNQLISIISHDIITPLKFISMVSRISKKNPDMLNRNKLIDSMKDIEFASDKLYNNASNILNWMKFQNNRIVPKMDHIALHEFINEIAEPLQGMAETKEITIENEVPEEDIIVSDRFILMIVLQNIISNAIKYSNHGEIIISTSEGSKYYYITITDNGIGMSTEVKNTIDNIIYRKVQLTSVQTDKKETGNQLGYFIISDFLQLLSGTLEVKSDTGKGTSVTVGIPE
jgi:signal transduction histidine kinase